MLSKKESHELLLKKFADEIRFVVKSRDEILTLLSLLGNVAAYKAGVKEPEAKTIKSFGDNLMIAIGFLEKPKADVQKTIVVDSEEEEEDDTMDPVVRIGDSARRNRPKGLIQGTTPGKTSNKRAASPDTKAQVEGKKVKLEADCEKAQEGGKNSPAVASKVVVEVPDTAITKQSAGEDTAGHTTRKVSIIPLFEGVGHQRYGKAQD